MEREGQGYEAGFEDSGVDFTKNYHPGSMIPELVEKGVPMEEILNLLGQRQEQVDEILADLQNK